MTKSDAKPQAQAVRRVAAPALLAGMAGLALVNAGCEVDGFLERNNMMRGEKTPGSAPILERLPAIEGPSSDGVEYSAITPEDLLPDPSAYRLGPGDVVEVEIQDLMRGDFAEKMERDVDARGYIDLPRLPSVSVLDMTVAQAQEAISAAVKALKVVDEPIVSLRVVVRRQLSFNIIGGVAQPGQYAVSKPNFRLLEALSQAGRFSETIPYVYVVRSVPLTDAAAGREFHDPGAAPAPAQPGPSTPANPGANPGAAGGAKPANPTSPGPDKPKDNILDIIDDITGEKPKPAQPAPSPAMFAAQPPAPARAIVPAAPPIDLPDAPAKTSAGGADAAAMPYPPAEEGPDWVFLGGQWVRASRRNLQQATVAPMPGNAGAATAAKPNAAEGLYTQRVIRIEVGPLLAGSAQHNIVIRPGDVIRVPSPSEGLVYVSGEVSRPGPYSIPSSGRLTALRAITAAGGLSQTAVPWRAEIVRMIGTDRQAFLRIDLAAIKEGTQPDIFLKSDDQLIVGTDFWAYPLAIVRSGLRASYGYGFILDRNFGADVFGERRFGGN